MRRIVTLILVLLGFNLMAQKPAIVTGTEKGWYQIGKISAAFKNERESIIVMGKDEFSTIKLRVSDAPISIEHLQIFFEGGKLQEVDVKQPLQPGEETREITLDADNKEIDKVVFTYRTLPNASGDKAEVELFGFKNAGTDESNGKAGIRNDQSEGNLKDAADKVEDDAEAAADRAEDQAEDLRKEGRETDNEALKDAADKVEDDAEAAENRAEENAEDMRDQARKSDDVEDAAERTGNDIEEGADKIHDETKEHANKLKSEITDRELEDKAGPHNEEIYIDNNNNYYYIDEQGNRMYVAPEELKARVRD